MLECVFLAKEAVCVYVSFLRGRHSFFDAIERYVVYGHIVGAQSKCESLALEFFAILHLQSCVIFLNLFVEHGVINEYEFALTHLKLNRIKMPSVQRVGQILRLDCLRQPTTIDGTVPSTRISNLQTQSNYTSRKCHSRSPVI